MVRVARDRRRVAPRLQGPRSTLPAVKNGEPDGPAPTSPPGPIRPRYRCVGVAARRWRITAAVIAIVVIWAVAAVIDVVIAADHIHHGEAAVQSARQGLSSDAILSGAPAGSLRSAQSSFSSAHGLLSSPMLWPVDVLPVVGRQLRSVQDLSGAAEQVAQTGVGAVGQSQSLLRLPHSAGPQRVAVLQQLATLAASTHRSLAGINLGPVQGLISPLQHERNTVAGRPRPDSDHAGADHRCRFLRRHHFAGACDVSPPGGQQRRDALWFGRVPRGRGPHHGRRRLPPVRPWSRRAL